MSRTVGGKYQLEDVIGHGGMGEVWAARNTATGASVAVKVFTARDARSDFAPRFRQEARLAAQLSHRNIVRVFDLIEEDGCLALVMERLHGETLESCIARGPLEPSAAMAVALPILSALSHAHEHGVVHRDLKPANLFLAIDGEGQVEPKLLDFGIARPAETSVHTLDGQALGTPEYMSPEQIRDAPDLDGKSDLFSLAIVLYEAMTGEHPFRVPTASARISAVLEATVDPHPSIPPKVWQVLSRALSKRAYERPVDAAAFRTSLEAAMVGSEAQPDSLRDVVLITEVRREPRVTTLRIPLELPTRRRPRLALALATLAAMVGFAWLLFHWTRHAEVSSPVATTPQARPMESAASSSNSAQSTAVVASSTPHLSASESASAAPVVSLVTTGVRKPTPLSLASGAPIQSKPSSASKPIATTPGF